MKRYDPQKTRSYAVCYNPTMVNPEMGESGRSEEDILSLLAEMMGVTFTRSEEYDPASAVTTEWTRRDDGLYYARVDTFPSGTPERFIRDDQEDGSRDNFITKQEENGTIVSVGYETGLPRDPDRFKLKLTYETEEMKTSFSSSYTPGGMLIDFHFQQDRQRPTIEEEVADELPEPKLKDIIDLYRLKGASAFEAATVSDLDGIIDLSGDIPQLSLGTWLPKRGYTIEDIAAVMELANIPVEYHLDSTHALEDMPKKDIDIIKGFLQVITASSLIPPLVHKNERNLLHRFEDIDPTTIEGFESLMLWYEVSISSFLKEHERSVERSGEYRAAFTPDPNDPACYHFALQQWGAGDREVFREQSIAAKEAVRYERSIFQVDSYDNVQVLTIQDIFGAKESECVVKFPRSFDAKPFKEVIDTHSVTSWTDGFDFVPFHFKVS